MNLDDYLELRDLFQAKWDPAILGVLDERPHRFLALVRKVRSTTHDDPTDRTVARSLDRLEHLGYIRAAPTRDGERQVPLYSLTRLGAQTLSTYRTVLSAYREEREHRGPARAGPL